MAYASLEARHDASAGIYGIPSLESGHLGECSVTNTNADSITAAFTSIRFQNLLRHAIGTRPQRQKDADFAVPEENPIQEVARCRQGHS